MVRSFLVLTDRSGGHVPLDDRGAPAPQLGDLPRQGHTQPPPPDLQGSRKRGQGTLRRLRVGVNGVNGFGMDLQVRHLDGHLEPLT